MLRRGPITTIFLSLLFTHVASSQGTFRNLSFELPIPPLLPVGGFVPATNAVPNWNVYLGSNQQNQVLYNNFFLGTAVAALEGPTNPYAPPLQGSYSLLLQAGQDPATPTAYAVNASIGQIGLVPATAQSLRFRVQGENFGASFGDIDIPLVNLGSGPNYQIYGGDISAFAGLTGQLRLSALSLPNAPFNWVYLDAIQFSDLPIPEPGFWSFALLSLLLFRMRWFRGTRR
jgi:hypothetical protein